MSQCDSSKVLRNNLDRITLCYITHDCQELGQFKLITTPMWQELLDPFPSHINVSIIIIEWEKGIGLLIVNCMDAVNEEHAIIMISARSSLTASIQFHILL